MGSWHVMIRITLLGGFDCRCDDQPVTGLSRTRTQSLLAYLVLHPSIAISRRHLAELFWPDSSAAQARTNLRRELHHLRQSAPAIDSALTVDAQHIRWDEPRVELDVQVFLDAISQATSASPHCESRGEALARALNCYQGDLLPGVFDDWVVTRRGELHAYYVQGLERYAHWLSEYGEPGDAARVVRELIALDPLHEPGYLQLMHLHIAHNEPARALQTYHQCCDTLRRELRTEPSEPLRSLYETLRHAANSAPSNQDETTTHFTSKADADASIQDQRQINYEHLSFVGREAQLAQLNAAWRETRRDGMRIALLTGEAGIGKTRLATEFIAPLRQSAQPVAFARAFPVAQGVTYQPIRQWLSSPAIAQHLSTLPASLRDQIQTFLAGSSDAQTGNQSANPAMGNAHRNRLFQTLSDALATYPTPLVLMLDDAQWCDADTSAWIQHCFSTQPKARMLLVATMRVDETPPSHPVHTLISTLQVSGQLTTVTVPALAQSQADLITHSALEHSKSDTHRVDASTLYSQSGGNPLFLIEYLRAQLDQQGTVTASDTTGIPDRVQAVIAHRLEQLDATALQLVDLAAVYDHTFSVARLLELSDLPESVVIAALDDLWRRQILHGTNDAQYDFSHDCLREVAYARIGPAKRTRLHQKIAQLLVDTLEKANPGNIHAAQIASHFDRANQSREAITWYKRAGTHARESSAVNQSIQYLERALTLGEQFDDVDLEAETLCQLRYAVIPVQGMSSDRVRDIIRRLDHLLPQIQSTEIRFLSLWAMRVYYAAAGYPQRGAECAEQCLILAKERPDIQGQVQVHALLGVSYWQLGQWGKSLETFEQGFRLAQSDERAESLAQPTMGHLQCVVGRGTGLAMKGEHEQARRAAEAFWAMPRTHLNRYIRGIIDLWIALLHMLLEDTDRVQYIGERMLERHETDYPVAISAGKLFTGWVHTRCGQLEQGVMLLREGIEQIDQLQHRIMFTQRLACLGEAELQLGDYDSALQSVERGIQDAAQSGETSFLSDLYRIRAQTVAAMGHPQSAVRQDFDKAIAIARSQQAALPEWHTWLALARYLGSNNQREEAVATLDGLIAIAERRNGDHPHPLLIQAQTERVALT